MDQEQTDRVDSQAGAPAAEPVIKATPDADTTGHKRFVRATEDEEEPQRPDEPERGRYSDRTLKVAVIPVAW